MGRRLSSLIALTLGSALLAGHAVAQVATALPEDPTFQAFGFADINYLTGDNLTNEGFVLGQLVGHAVARISDRLNVFGEATATARDSEYDFEIERIIARYDFSDRYMVSAGRYHTPIGYWNTAYHHGTWLQTSVGRPANSRVIPIHFVGMQVEGTLPRSPLGLGYRVGIGNGRHSNIARAGDAGDVNGSRAYSLSLESRPISVSTLDMGVSFYSDRISPPAGPEVDEDIVSVFLAWVDETPEIIAEYLRATHDMVSGGGSGNTSAYYVQVAYRLPERLRQFKPYLRVEEVDVGTGDPLLSGLGLDYKGTIAGVRFDFTPFAALKFEYHNEKFGNGRREDNFFVQLSMLIGGQ